MSAILRLICIAVVAITASCADRPSNVPAPAAPAVEQLHPAFSFVWSAKPSVDLSSRPAELVRATEEALQLTWIFGPQKSFPGYLGSIAASNRPGDLDFEFNTRQDRPGFVEIAKSPQTQFFHIAQLEVSNDHRNIDAVVCGYTLAAPQNSTALNPSSPRDARHIELSGPASDQRPTSIIDGHPDRTDPRAQMPPTWNVFESWRITKLEPYADPRKIPASCGDWWQSQLPYLYRPPGMNFLNAPPGDPDFRMPREPVKPQFPEWIKADQG